MLCSWELSWRRVHSIRISGQILAGGEIYESMYTCVEKESKASNRKRVFNVNAIDLYWSKQPNVGIYLSVRGNYVSSLYLALHSRESYIIALVL